MNRKGLIPIAALITAGTITLADIQGNGKLPGTREWLGFVIVFTMLSAGADLGIPFAGGFAILVMITVLLTRGLEALEFITGKVEKPKKQKGTKRGSTPNLDTTHITQKA
jgi:hypothetical protein